ncbi:translation initiation factor [Helicobacter turcicus]|uniref:Translation initiation factor n=1 Tax=Helicobacter turcicus TaxID=2867412 RepID=A0ABS7JKG7_9HELI|nr:translation initiation factor [Helicobacter turcicus]MBX7489883.1 translation initiation factor [Helicobacter turcicus]MBX7544743.1 translation initiation factor [Helicobacter turcicus]
MVQLDFSAKFSDRIDCVCKKCGELESACICGKGGESKMRDSYFLGINEEKAKGKDITRCGIFFEEKQAMQEILKEAKKKFSCGGSLDQDSKGFWLILQGRHKDALKALLKAQKFQFKK